MLYPLKLQVFLCGQPCALLTLQFLPFGLRIKCAARQQALHALVKVLNYFASLLERSSFRLDVLMVPFPGTYGWNASCTPFNSLFWPLQVADSCTISSKDCGFKAGTEKLNRVAYTFLDAFYLQICKTGQAHEELLGGCQHYLFVAEPGKMLVCANRDLAACAQRLCTFVAVHVSNPSIMISWFYPKSTIHLMTHATSLLIPAFAICCSAYPRLLNRLTRKSLGVDLNSSIPRHTQALPASIWQ